MICHGTKFLPFYRKCQGPTSVHPPSPSRFWTCCWTLRQTGRLQPGGSDAAVFSSGTSTLHSSNLPHSHEMIQCLLYHIPHHQPLPLNRTLDVLLHILPGRPRLCYPECESYLSVLWNMQISLGLPDPREQSSMPLLKWVQASIARTRKAKDNPSQVRLSITVHLLRRICHVLSGSDHPEKIVLWAIACTAFFWFFRLGELLPQSAKPNDSGTGLAWGQAISTAP